MPAIHVTDDQFEAEVLKSKIPVIVDFYAEWCGPCKMAGPILDKLADEYQGKVKIIKVDTDSSALSGNYGVMSIPTVIAFKDGKEIENLRQIGFGGEQKYRELLHALSA